MWYKIEVASSLSLGGELIERKDSREDDVNGFVEDVVEEAISHCVKR